MKKKIAKISMVVMVITFIVGLRLIFSATSIGEDIGLKEMQANGGQMDTSQYERIVTSNTENFRVGGLVLSLVCGFGAVISGYALYNEIDEHSLIQPDIKK